jgi:Protein of unknown function (DUF1592)/Protein of unknown function (DUF1588)/Protein of unknown function (DUF1587)/Protein of unknown function (DUF1595)/Protein of unknown function (DUF1585)
MLRCDLLGFFRLATGIVAVFSAQAAGPTLEQQFTLTVRPFVTKYCVGCHSGETPAGQFDLKTYATMDSVVRDHPRWALLADRLTAKEMPPAPMPQPPAELRQQIVDWVKAMRASEARKSTGDPGTVLARRLSNAEYDYTIRDLTGVDIRPTREFPVDPANPAGFDNSGESLSMSPALLNKYLQAAREVGDRMVLTPDGFDFARHPMLVETDRDKYTTMRIVDFYLRQPTDYAGYFEAAWRYKYRAILGKPDATLADIAADSKISPKYLAIVWPLLEEPADVAKTEVGPIAKLQAMWRALPIPDGNQLDPKSLPVHAQCIEMRDFVTRIRKHTAMQFTAPVVRGLPPGSQPLLDWKLYEFAAHRRESDPKTLLNDTDTPPAVPEIPRYPGLHQEAAPRWAALSAKARAGDLDLVVPAAERSRYEASFSRFASVFPDTFYVTERGRYFPDDSDDKGRLLSAGYHSVIGFFRDDTPLMELILDEKGQQQINRLWDEFEFIADYTARTFVQYYFNQSGEVAGRGDEGGTPRPEGKEVTDSDVIFKMRDAYIAKALADPKNGPIAPEAIRVHFQRVNDALRRIEKMRADAEPHHLEALLKFASRAYRRPLSKAESDDILAYYHSLREKGGLSHEDAIRDSIVSVLMSPDFCYRIDLLDSGAKPRTATAKAAPRVAPLPTYALANRLSYFLWSSMPDRELLDHAAAGDLGKPDVLLAQTRRMLKDPKVRGMATEFGGNWLDFRRFETHNAVDRERFPEFTADLREAMFQEPIRLLDDVIENNRTVLDLIYGDYTFVNPSLAKHYGMPAVPGGEDNWVRVDNAGIYHRGGLIPMAVFLTQNSPGLRTSPVKRGYWVVRRVLGEVIPPPPPVVPELPSDEAKSDLPIRDMLAQHRANPACNSCHSKFDVFGLAFEGYGPVGDNRTKDLAGRLVDAMATFPGGSQGSGFEGVRDYIREHRQGEYLENISRKLLAYSLSRSLQLSDEITIDQMKTNLAAAGNRFGSLVETIVTSPQFLNKREPVPVDRTALTKER